ncbi:MAG: sulfurtransferase [Chloroflexi bacterium]|nr:sulfurtransferase [Chloroflexota bacterium]
MSGQADDSVPALVDGAWLAEHLDDPDLRVLHIANDRAEYDEAHVRGAVYAHGYGDFTEDRDGVRALVPSPERMAANLSRLGVSPDERIVCTAGARSAWPARAYWVLRYYRFPRVHLADGAVPALREAGVPVDAEAPPVAPTDVTLPEPDEAIIALSGDVLEAAEGGPARIIDCRSDGEWLGEAHGHAEAPRMGRIPRAVHLEWERLVREDGRLLPLEQLRSLFSAAGVDGSVEAYPYCGGGVRSAVAWFVMHELLGYERARNYDGSWSEWAVREELPIERG